MSDAVREPSRTRLIAAAILLGIGLGGFFDGIVLHQILQWHHLVSGRNPPTTVDSLELNTLADGLFHLLAWVVTVTGVFVLVSSNGARHEEGGTPTLAGGMLAGWGSFNLAEGLVDHQLLGLHHVRPGPDELVYDVGFLIWGAIMLAIGVALARRARDRARPSVSGERSG